MIDKQTIQKAQDKNKEFKLLKQELELLKKEFEQELIRLLNFIKTYNLRQRNDMINSNILPFSIVRFITHSMDKPFNTFEYKINNDLLEISEWEQNFKRGRHNMMVDFYLMPMDYLQTQMIDKYIKLLKDFIDERN